MMTMATEDRAVVADEEVVWGTSLYKIISNLYKIKVSKCKAHYDAVSSQRDDI